MGGSGQEESVMKLDTMCAQCPLFSLFLNYFQSGWSLPIDLHFSSTYLIPCMRQDRHMSPTSHANFLFKQISALFCSTADRSIWQHPCKGQPGLLHWSQSGVWFDHSLACQSLVVLSVVLTRPQPVIWRVLVRRDGGSLSCCRSNLAHKWRRLSALFPTPVTTQWLSNPLIQHYLSGRTRVATVKRKILSGCLSTYALTGVGTSARSLVWRCTGVLKACPNTAAVTPSLHQSQDDLTLGFVIIWHTSAMVFLRKTWNR